jgi:hypothetical protein
VNPGCRLHALPEGTGRDQEGSLLCQVLDLPSPALLSLRLSPLGLPARLLLRDAAIDPGRRAGTLTAGQRERLLVAVGTMRQYPRRRR